MGKRVYKNKPKPGRKSRIRRWKLIGDNKKVFLKKVKVRLVWNVEGNLNYVWKRIAKWFKNTAKEIVGESKSCMPENKETWRRDKEAQRIIVSKKKQFKVWQKNGRKEDWTE